MKPNVHDDYGRTTRHEAHAMNSPHTDTDPIPCVADGYDPSFTFTLDRQVESLPLALALDDQVVFVRTPRGAT